MFIRRTHLWALVLLFASFSQHSFANMLLSAVSQASGTQTTGSSFILPNQSVVTVQYSFDLTSDVDDTALITLTNTTNGQVVGPPASGANLSYQIDSAPSSCVATTQPSGLKCPNLTGTNSFKISIPYSVVGSSGYLLSTTASSNAQEFIRTFSTDIRNATAGRISFASLVASANETAGSISVDVIRSGGSDGPVSVFYTTAAKTGPNSATADVDYTTTSNTLFWADADSAPKTITIPIANDGIAESTELFQVQLSSVTVGATLGIATLDITIQDASTSGTVGFSNSSYSVTESAGTATITVARTDTGSGAVSVDYATSSGQGPGYASAGKDYSAANGTLTWSDGDVQPKTFAISITNDQISEGAEKIDLSLSNIVGAKLGTSNATLTINDGKGQLQKNTQLNNDQQKVAGVLDDACTTASGDLAKRCTELKNLSDANSQQALEEVLPRVYFAQAQAAFDVAKVQVSNVRNRLDTLRGAGPRSSMNGLTLSIKGESLPMSYLTDMPRGGSAGEDTNATAHADTRFGTFINGRINVGKQDTTGTETGYNFETAGLTFGGDYRLRDSLVMGATLGVAKTYTDIASRGGDLDTKSIELGWYGNWYPVDKWYVDWVLTYGLNKYASVRNIIYDNFSTSTDGTTNGKQMSASTSVGWDTNVRAWQLGGYWRIDYFRNLINGFSESGGQGLALKIDSQTSAAWTNAFGGKVSRAISWRKGVFVPSLFIEWAHELKDQSQEITARLKDAPSLSFSLSSTTPDKNYFNYGFSLVSVFTGGKSAYLSAQGVAGQDHRTNYTLEAGGRYEF